VSPSDLDRPPEPLRLGRFELDAIIGEGGMGTVWRGRHLPDGAPIALKLIRPSVSWGGQARQMFAREVRAVASLHHPAIVHVLDLGEIDNPTAGVSGGYLPAGAPWMVMELCSGGTLSQHRGNIGWPRLRPVLLRLLDALAHAHARGVIHRDIKPGNVLLGTGLDQRAGLKLTDFGIARVQDAGAGDPTEAEGTFAGSPSYCSPEQLMGDQRSIGPWTDLYSVGCLTWCLATGEPPFGSRLPLGKLVAAHVGGRLPTFEPLDPVPPAFVDWLHSMLARRPEDRFQSAADAAWALRELAPLEAEEELPPDVAPVGAAQGLQTRTRLRSKGLTFATEAFTSSGQNTRVDVTALARTAASQFLEIEAARSGSGLGPGPAAARGRPPLPEDWRRLDSPAPLKLLGAGLGLYASRTVPLVGREAERDRIWGALHDVVREGTARCVVVQGPSGVGKSRLVRWMGERAEELGVASVVSAVHGSPAGPADGLAPMVARWMRLTGRRGSGLVRGVLKFLRARGDDDRYLASALSELVEPGSSTALDSSVRVDLGQARQRWHALSALLDVASQDRPVLLWLDDVQWAPDALGLAGHLLARRNLDRRQVLIVATVRPELLEPESVEADRLEELLELDGVDSLDLGPLLGEAQRRLVEELLHLDESLAADVVDRTAGNPLFALQLVGDWVRRGVLQPGRGGFVPAPEASLDIPDDIHHLWRARFKAALDPLGMEARVATETAAALGAQVDPELWARATGRGRAELGAVADTLLAHGLATATEEGWAFTHGMARESAVRSARDHDRATSIHSRCADALADRADPASLAQRGRHLLAGGRPAEACDDLWTAVRALERRGDAAEARALLEALETALRQRGDEVASPDVLRCRLQSVSLDRLLGRRDLDVALEALIHDAREAEVVDVQVGAETQMGRVLRDGGHLQEGTRMLREAHRRGSVHGLVKPTAQAALGLAWALTLSGEYDEAASLFSEAAGLHAQGGELAGLARAHLGLAEVHKFRRRFTEGRAAAVAGLEAAEAAGDTLAIADACAHLATVEREVKGPQAAVPWLERARSAAARLGSGTKLGGVLNLVGDNARAAGDLDGAEAALLEALATFEPHNSGWTPVVRLNLAVVYMEQGRFEAAEAPLNRARAMLERDGRRALLEAADLLRLPVLATLQDRDGLVACLAAAETVGDGWRRPSEECAHALRWAGPITRRAGWPDLADRIDAVAERYAALL